VRCVFFSSFAIHSKNGWQEREKKTKKASKRVIFVLDFYFSIVEKKFVRKWFCGFAFCFFFFTFLIFFEVAY